jgi:hypothetical protein
MSCNCNSSSPCGCSDISTLPTGPAGASTYVYIGYASDDEGSDFSLTDVTLCYKAIITSTVQLVPTAPDFEGLWFNTCGTNGSNGTNGTNGSNGSAGAAGCNPDITITAVVEGGSEEYEIDVTEGGTTCSPTYELSFPIDIFEDEAVVDAITASTEFTTAINTAVATLFSVTPTTGTFTTISDSGTPDIKYSSAGAGVLALNATSENSYSYILVGKTLIYNFAFGVDAGVEFDDDYTIEIKLPASKTSVNTKQHNSISVDCISSSYSHIQNPCITTRYVTSTSYLGLSANGKNYTSATLSPFYIVAGTGAMYFRGQITINIA